MPSAQARLLRLAFRYGCAVLAVAAAVGLRWLLQDLFGGETSFVTFYPVVALVAIMAGGGPGVLATVLSAVIASGWLLVGMHGAGEVVAVGLFAASGLLVTAIAELLRCAGRREAAALEEQVAERTAHLECANARLRNEIEDRQRAEASLREQEEWLRMAQAAGGVGTFVWDFAGQNARCSEEYFRVMGAAPRPAGDVTYAEWRSWLHPEDRDRIQGELDRSLADAEEAAADYRIVGADGRTRWISYRGRITRDAAGRPIRMLGTVQDITTRKAAGEALRRAHELSESIINTTPNIVLLLDTEARILRLNPFTERLTGWRLAEVKGGDWFDTFLPERDRDRIRGLFRRALSGERVRANVNSIVTRDGQERDIEWYDTPLASPGGELVGLLCTGQDVTERRRAEQALRDSERRLQAFLDNSALLAWMKDEDGRYVFLSENYQKRFGVRFESWRGKTDLELWPHDIAVEFRRNDRAVLAGGRAIEVVEESVDPDGSRSYWLSSKFPFQDQSGKRYVGGLAIDITERKRAEQALLASKERMNAILNTASDAIVTIDQGGTIRSVNPAVERMFGYTQEELVGEKVNMLMPAPYCDEHDRYITHYLETGEAHIIGRGREVVGRRKDGSTFPADLAVSEIGHLKLFTGILRDITRRKELEREVVEIASMEQRRIGQDLHDTVGQELTALRLLVSDLGEILQSDAAKASPLVEQMAQGLQRSQRELRAVLRGLLPVAVDTQGLMAALADLTDRIQQEGKVACTFDCPEPVTVADNLIATHLYLIAQEAVHNAVKHAQARNVPLTLKKVDEGLVLSIRDDGVGMPGAPTEPQGVGLRVMRNRAAILGATLTIEPARPTGTLVTCLLPRRNDERQKGDEAGPGADRR